ncbi:MAG TPA: helix-hairpin-helix domain-containing protein [Terracidiphilus sp.]|nr:helix-hairpin-helix domain-containing protein [Terracidiphilus sp.]
MKTILLAIAPLILLVGCQQSNPNPSPEKIRQDAAKATSTAVEDVKAAAQGVKEGLQKKEPVNLNTASLGELETLPGIDDAAAQKILERRPYSEPSDLVKKHAVSKDEYDRISDRVIAR